MCLWRQIQGTLCQLLGPSLQGVQVYKALELLEGLGRLVAEQRQGLRRHLRPQLQRLERGSGLEAGSTWVAVPRKVGKVAGHQAC